MVFGRPAAVMLCGLHLMVQIGCKKILFIHLQGSLCQIRSVLIKGLEHGNTIGRLCDDRDAAFTAQQIAFFFGKAEQSRIRGRSWRI